MSAGTSARTRQSRLAASSPGGSYSAHAALYAVLEPAASGVAKVGLDGCRSRASRLCHRHDACAQLTATDRGWRQIAEAVGSMPLVTVASPTTHARHGLPVTMVTF